jgi:hypothetical protein
MACKAGLSIRSCEGRVPLTAWPARFAKQSPRPAPPPWSAPGGPGHRTEAGVALIRPWNGAQALRRDACRGCGGRDPLTCRSSRPVRALRGAKTLGRSPGAGRRSASTSAAGRRDRSPRCSWALPRGCGNIPLGSREQMIGPNPWPGGSAFRGLVRGGGVRDGGAARPRFGLSEERARGASSPRSHAAPQGGAGAPISRWRGGRHPSSAREPFRPIWRGGPPSQCGAGTPQPKAAASFAKPRSQASAASSSAPASQWR